MQSRASDVPCGDTGIKPLSERGTQGYREAAVYIGTFLLALLLFLTIKPLYETDRNGVVAQSIAAVAAGGCLFAGAFLAASGKLTKERLVALLFAVGVILRIAYMLYTPASVRQQDTYSSNFNGHEAYAWTIFSTGKLPSVNDYQFYHPPLNALLQAAFMHFMQDFSGSLTSLFSLGDYFPGRFLSAKPEYIEAERYFLYQSCQILSVLYSVVTCYVGMKLLKRMGVRGWTYVGLSAFLIFFPRNFQMSGQLNNDGISYMCSMLSLYFAVKWQKEKKSFANILACAVSVGAGMMAKLTSATVCLPIAGIFVCEFVRTLQKKGGALSFPRLAGEYAAFLAVCAPLGLWFQVYAKIRFDQPFGFVFSNLNQRLYTGDHSFFGRFFIALDADEYFGSLWCRPFDGNYNLFHYALRSAIFGEFSYWQGEGFAVAAVVLAYVAVIVLAVSLVRVLVLCVRDGKRGRFGTEEGRRDVLFVFLLVQSQAVSEIFFYVGMPYACTMDFRYIMPMIPGIALTIWLTGARLKREGDAFSLALNRLTAVSFGGALLFSTLFYMVCI